ncbi:MAG: hypothetical protein CFH10_01422 [Alphaproteobacteria bacterium MarineAlpha4_Bin2]|nr:MAG: hypothetical protein CFH10_01422 [Alphaproteobacteria bacterium MarineAlpha4_Bin2]
MAKPEWGKKRTCQNCGAKYYDLQKDPPVCPKCETVFQKETNQRSRRNRTAPDAPKAIPKAAAAADTDEVDVEGIDDAPIEDDDSVPEDTSDLGGDDEDVSDVIDNVETARDES